jgi:DNA gyrase subunit A
VTVSHQGYLKRTPISIYRQQRRGGTGRTGMKTREEDFVAQLIVDSTHAFLLCFTNTGPRLLAQGLRDSRRGRGRQGQVDAEPARPAAGRNVRAILPVRDLEEEGKFIFFATRNGTVKKTPLKDFSNVMARGIIAIGIDKDDELVKARITDGSQIVFLATHLGMAIRFDENDVRSMGRPAYGVRGIDLAKNDYVVGVAVTPKEHAGRVPDSCHHRERLWQAHRCRGIPLANARRQGRKEHGRHSAHWPVSSIQLVDDTSELMVISQFGKIIRIDTKTIRAAGRATQGVRLLNLEPKTRLPRRSSFRRKN